MTLEQLMSVAHAWLPCFDKMEVFEFLLRDHGYCAFDVYTNFLKQFANDPEDILVHKLCYKERAKVTVTTSGVLRGHPVECQHRYYKSTYLEEKRVAKSIAEGFDSVAEWQRSKLQTWQKEIDPLVAASLLNINSRGRDVIEHYSSVLKDETKSVTEREAERFPKGALGSFGSNRLKTFAEASQEFMSPLGFKPVSTKLVDYFAMDFDVGFGYVLRWSINEENNIFLINPIEAICQPMLNLCPSSFRKRVKDSDRNSRFLVIPFTLLVEGFSQAYNLCHSNQGIYLNVSASSVIVSRILPILCRAVSMCNAM